LIRKDRGFQASHSPWSEARSNEAELKFWRQTLAMEEAAGKVGKKTGSKLEKSETSQGKT